MSLDSISRFVLRHKLLIVLFWVAMTIAGVVSTGPVANAFTQHFDCRTAPIARPAAALGAFLPLAQAEIDVRRP